MVGLFAWLAKTAVVQHRAITETPLESNVIEISVLEYHPRRGNFSFVSTLPAVKKLHVLRFFLPSIFGPHEDQASSQKVGIRSDIAMCLGDEPFTRDSLVKLLSVDRLLRPRSLLKFESKHEVNDPRGRLAQLCTDCPEDITYITHVTYVRVRN